MTSEVQQRLASGLTVAAGLCFSGWAWNGMDGVLVAVGALVTILGVGMSRQATERERRL